MRSLINAFVEEAISPHYLNLFFK